MKPEIFNELTYNSKHIIHDYYWNSEDDVIDLIREVWAMSANENDVIAYVSETNHERAYEIFHVLDWGIDVYWQQKQKEQEAQKE